MSSLRCTRLLILGLCIASALVLFVSSSDSAFARLQCRSDPLVVLSDGTVIDISADIGTMLYNVKQVRYILYIPNGLKVVTHLSTPNWPTTKEQFTVYATNPVGKFTTTVVVVTREAMTPVTANFLLNTKYAVKQGFSGQRLTLKIWP